MEAPRRDGAPTRTLTAVIAERLKTLRTEARLSGPGLAAAMNDRGIPWNRTTVAKLETGRRETISVQELLALAVVLDVPPVWLLADPEASTRLPIAEGVDADPHLALMWMTGKWPLSDQPGAAWGEAASTLAELHAAFDAVGVLRTLDKLGREPAPTAEHRKTQDEMTRQQLESLRASLMNLAKKRGATMSLPSHVLSQARRLGVELPGQEDEQ